MLCHQIHQRRSTESGRPQAARVRTTAEAGTGGASIVVRFCACDAPGMPPVPRSLVWATDLDVLPLDHVVERRDDHLVVRSPGNPSHFWGNLLLFDQPPAPGDGERWEALFAAEFA